MIEFFAVTPGQDDDFLAAWTAANRDDALYRALRDDIALRFAGVPPDPRGGVLLIAVFETAPTLPDLTGRQGFIGERRETSADGRPAVVIHWSSPLMYQRTVQALGDFTSAASHAALYSPVG